MSYPREIMFGSLFQQTAWMATAQSLTQAAAVYGGLTVRKPIVVQELSFYIGTAVNNLTSSVVAAEVVTGLQNSTPVTTAVGGTLTIPNGATAGTVYVNNSFTPTYCPAGSILQFKLKTQGGLGGTPAGAGFCGFYASYSPENDTNAAPTTAASATAGDIIIITA
jgi:hypothetical protein